MDYGKLGMWRDPATDRRVAVWAFAMILTCSRMLFAGPVLRMDHASSSWCASRVAAFEFFGVRARMLCDNLGDRGRAAGPVLPAVRPRLRRTHRVLRAAD